MGEAANDAQRPRTTAVPSREVSIWIAPLTAARGLAVELFAIAGIAREWRRQRAWGY